MTRIILQLPQKGKSYIIPRMIVYIRHKNIKGVTMFTKIDRYDINLQGVDFVEEENGQATIHFASGRELIVDADKEKVNKIVAQAGRPRNFKPYTEHKAT